MAEKKGSKTFYGMRLVPPNKRLIGLCWEISDCDEIVLRHYHISQYGKYIYDEYEKLVLTSVCYRAHKNDVLRYLKNIANKVKPSHNIYIDEVCYKAIVKECECNEILGF